LTPANAADISQAPALLGHAPKAKAVIADKGYDADALVEHIEAQGAQAVIPPRKHRKAPRDYDRHRYQARNLIERLIRKLKAFRRLATRYEKLDTHFAAFLSLVCTCLWLA
jgi:transposase